MNNFTHNSVLLTESINALNIKKDGIYIDGTFGRGGHTLAIAKELTTGKIIAFDKDLDAINYAKENLKSDNIEVVHSDFANMYKILESKKLIGKIDGILLDLGVSSPQLDDKNRGFSFTGDNPLDMRMDKTQDLDATGLLKNSTEEEIANIIYRYGDERRSRIIAKKIKEFQLDNDLNTTKQLADIVCSVVQKTGKKHPATRTFQALRIHINSELVSLENFLNSSIEILKKNGRLSIITFHSLEDRIVKKFIKENSQAKQVPKNMPFLNVDEVFLPLKAIKKIKPNKNEIDNNIRSRSSILRIAEKC